MSSANSSIGDDMDACFNAFDTDGDGLLGMSDFGQLCCALFRNDRGSVYTCTPEMHKEMFQVFDQNQDGFIDKTEFKFCWNRWIQKIIHPVSVLLVVDVQNDFISGSLSLSDCPAKHNGGEVIEPINALLDSVVFVAVCYTYDWHPADHISFFDNLPLRKLHSSSPVAAGDVKMCDTVKFEGSPPVEMRLWPRHCVQDSWGAELHKDLKVMAGAVKVYKGVKSEIDSFSAFFDNQKLSKTCLEERLREFNATDVYVCGLAYDICVGATATDALNLGYRTVLVDDCCRGVDVNGIEATKKQLKAANGIIINSQQVGAMVEGRDRRPELGYKLCQQLKNELNQTL